MKYKKYKSNISYPIKLILIKYNNMESDPNKILILYGS